jgi:membrane fusion protein, multidrug efflux system
MEAIMNKKILLPIGIILGILSVAGGGTYWWTTWRFIETTDNASVKANITPISAKISEYAKDVPVVENQLVKKGDLLVQLDPEQLNLQVKNAEANVDVRKAALTSLKEQMIAQNLIIKQTQAQLKAAASDKKITTNNWERTSDLLGKKFASPQSYDAASNSKVKAEEAYNGMVSNLKTQQQQIHVIEANIKQNEALLNQAVVAKNIANDNLADTTLRAPMDGMIVKKVIEPGQYVRPGSVLMSIVPTNDIWVEANYKETQISRMKPGLLARIKVDSFPELKIEGVIESIAPSTGSQFSLLPPENASGNFTKIVQKIPVRIKLKSEDVKILKPGQSVIVTINTKKA